jgi:hypothetical protein
MLVYSPGRYFAGLWERDIHYLLGWSSVLSDDRCYRPKEPEATVPSFSWASRFGPVSFPFECLMTRVCTVLDIRCEAKGADPYGQVRGEGHIVLQGKLISGTAKDHSVAVWDARGEECSAFLEFDTEEDEEDLNQDLGARVYCFDLFRETEWRDGSGEEADCHRSHSIVLREGKEPGTFERVGIASGILAPTFDAVPDVVVKIF